MFVLMRGLGRAGVGDGWVKIWAYQNLCAVGVLGMQHLIPCLVPRGQGVVE